MSQQTTIALYSYNPESKRFGIQVGEQEYTFEYVLDSYSEKNFRDESGKIIARGYKGFRNKIGIKPGSSDAQRLRDELGKCPQYLK